jgi:hypothetical protein
MYYFSVLRNLKVRLHTLGHYPKALQFSLHLHTYAWAPNVVSSLRLSGQICIRIFFVPFFRPSHYL